MLTDPEFKRKWVEALRSDKYKQGKRNLFNGRSYCCLGVACVVASATFSVAPENGLWDPILDGVNIRRNQVLSNDYINKIGLTGPEMETLTAMNDGLGVPSKDFNFIADWIEKNL